MVTRGERVITKREKKKKKQRLVSLLVVLGVGALTEHKADTADWVRNRDVPLLAQILKNAH